MCYFVTLGIPAKYRTAVEALAKQRGGLGVEPVPNRSVARLFPQGDALFVITNGGCSCDLYAEPSRSSPAADEANQRARYRRKGWSEAKISRALEARARSRVTSGREDCRARFLDVVATLVEDIGRVQLFAHEYSGRIDTEDVSAGRAQTITLETFRYRGGGFDVDTVVEVVKGAG